MGRCRLYELDFRLLPHALYGAELSVTPAQVLRYMETTFFQRLMASINHKFIELNRTSLLNSAKVRSKAPAFTSGSGGGGRRGGGDEDENDVEDDDQHDGDATAERNRQRQQDDGAEYEGEEEDRDAVGEESAESDIEFEDDDAASHGSLPIDQSAMEEDIMCPGTPPTPTQATPSRHKVKAKKKKRRPMDDRRINEVLKVPNVTQYSYDADDELWCKVTIRVVLSDKRLDMTSLVEEEARRQVVYKVPNISRAFLSESTKPGEEGTHLKTEGVNIHAMYKHDRILDLNRLYTNDIHAIANHYGIEAASKVIIKEMRDVFAAYGIVVDYHHLSLIADYMTFEGTYKAFNRMGLESNPSPLQKMSFETTMSFLKTATLQGVRDELTSPSSRIVVGKVVSGGTGCFSLLQPLRTS